MPVPTNWHPGEIAAQQARGFEDAVWGGWEGYQDGSPDWMILFLTQLQFLSVTTLDKNGRPWSSILHNDGNPGFIKATDKENHFTLSIKAANGIPIRDCLLDLYQRFNQGESAFDHDGVPKNAFQMAGVGIMLHNRRRNKLESVIVAVHTIPKDEVDDQFVFEAQAISTFGNCPKYINTRLLQPTNQFNQSLPKPLVHSSSFTGQDLPKEVLDLIANADSLYLASRYSGNDPSTYSPDPPRLGNNHRGGPAGYLRTFWDEKRQRRCIILPDWSGNRLMMSFGNITKDPFAGFSIPIWTQNSQEKSSVIYATCSAQVLADEDAQQLMRGIRGAVKMWIEDWTFAKGTIPMYVKSSNAEEEKGSNSAIGWSPYNPPVRFLKSEQTIQTTQSNEIKAEMINAHFWSESVATFTFSVKDEQQHISSNFKPGKHIVIDCSDAMDTRLTMYAHMAQFRGGEKDLNDDGTRSWTIAYASPFQQEDQNHWQFEIVLRRKNRGGVTPTLFRVGKYISEALEEGMKPPSFKPKLNILGLDGSSILPFRATTSDQPLQLVYLLSGIGVTPVLSHLSTLASDPNAHANILIVLATRKNEAGIMQGIVRNAISRELKKKKSDTTIGRLKLKLILLVSDTAVEDDDEIMNDSEQESKGWESLPKNVHVEVTQLHGKRITSRSFDQNQNETPYAFILSSADTAMYMKKVDMALICAAQKFAKIAQESLMRAGVSESVQHVESFSF